MLLIFILPSSRERDIRVQKKTDEESYDDALRDIGCTCKLDGLEDTSEIVGSDGVVGVTGEIRLSIEFDDERLRTIYGRGGCFGLSRAGEGMVGDREGSRGEASRVGSGTPK